MKRGEIYIITDGSYEDYRIVDAVAALRDFDFDVEAAKNTPRGNEIRRAANSMLRAFQVRTRWVEHGATHASTVRAGAWRS